MDLRPGAVLRVDEGEEIAVPYLQCTQAGCDASIKLEAKLLWAMKQGEQFLVGFRAWGSDQTNVVNASLIGFTKAFQGLQY